MICRLFHDGVCYFTTPFSLAENLQVDKHCRMTVLAAVGEKSRVDAWTVSQKEAIVTALGFDIPVTQFHRGGPVFHSVSTASTTGRNDFLTIRRICQTIREAMSIWDSCSVLKILIKDGLTRWVKVFGQCDPLLCKLVTHCCSDNPLQSCFRHLVFYVDQLFNEIDVEQESYAFRGPHTPEDRAFVQI
jgi:hypothetical protein